jgi:hypothetical protein
MPTSRFGQLRTASSQAAPVPSAEAPPGLRTQTLDEAEAVATRLRPRPASALSRFSRCSNDEYARVSRPTSAMNLRVGALLVDRDDAFENGGLRSTFLTQLMSTGRDASTRGLSLLEAEAREADAAAQSRAVSMARLTQMPKHRRDLVPRVVAKSRHAGINSRPVAAAEAMADSSGALDVLDAQRFPNALVRCAFLRSNPVVRRAFAERVDSDVAAARREQATVRRQRVQEQQATDREMAEAYLATSAKASPRRELSRSSLLVLEPSGSLSGSRNAGGGGRRPTMMPPPIPSPGAPSSGDYMDVASQLSAIRRDNEAYMQQALKASHALRRRQRQNDANQRREGLQSWRLARTIDELQKPEFNRVRRLREAEAEVLSNTWSVVVCLAMSLYEWHDRFVGELARRHAPRSVVQRYTHPGVAMHAAASLRASLRLRRATRIIEAFWFRLRHRYFRHKKHVAAALLVRFLRDLGESIRIPIAVKKQLKTVRLVQRRYRSRAALREARRWLCVRQVRASLVTSNQQDELEISKLHSMLKQHERELSLKKGLHRVARQESLAKVAAMVNSRVEFIGRRREASRSFTDAQMFAAVDAIMNHRETAFGDTAYRYGFTWKYHLMATSLHVELSTQPGSGPAEGSGGSSRGARAEASAKVSSSKLASSISRSLITDAADQTAAKGRRSGGSGGGSSNSGERSRPVLVPPSNPMAKPVRPHFRSLLTAEEVNAVVLACMEGAEKRHRTEDAAMSALEGSRRGSRTTL